jgi:hypothetical protein
MDTIPRIEILINKPGIVSRHAPPSETYSQKGLQFLSISQIQQGEDRLEGCSLPAAGGHAAPRLPMPQILRQPAVMLTFFVYEEAHRRALKRPRLEL